jgi:4,5-DOPA dioxygenase extradiol
MMPAIFVGHGNPMYAIEENEFTRNWRRLGESLPKPKAVAVISAHWETAGTFVTANPRLRTIHDFYGFPEPLFEVTYEAPGSPGLAREISARVTKTNVVLDESWGLDHGTWSVLRHLFPKADIPTIQISLDRTKTPLEHYKIAADLRFLREQDVLVIGSGNIVHNLGLINFRDRSGDEWAVAANERLKELIFSGDHESLTDYRRLGREVQLAIPTPEHFLPALYVLALRGDGERLEVFNDVVELGSISMTSFRTGN